MRYFKENGGCIEMSVGELCSMAFVGGDLDTRFPPVSLRLRAMGGQELHKKIQSDRGDYYHAEVAMRNTSRLDGVTFAVSGRADGVFLDELGGIGVEEIKSVSNISSFARPRQADMAQLLCYGYFLTVSRGVSAVTLRLSYVSNSDGDTEVCYNDTYMSADQLKASYMGILGRVLFRAKQFLYSNTELRDLAAMAIFPYKSMRDAQEEMIRECWRDMRMGEIIFAQAPTGIGKTISTLYSAVRVFGEGRCDKIFYLTAKASTRREAYAAVGKLNSSGMPVRSCVITSRESVCINESAKLMGGNLSRCCNPELCPYAKGYYDRSGEVIRELLEQGTNFSAKAIRDVAARAGVCPYELALDLSELCEIIICDYNYVFSPSVYLRRYFADHIPGSDGHRYIFLVDEAHNLVDRARDMYSGEINLNDVRILQNSIDEFEKSETKYIFPNEDIAQHSRLESKMFDGLVGHFMGMGHFCEENKSYDDNGISHGFALLRDMPVELSAEAETIGKRCEQWLRYNTGHQLYSEVERFSSLLRIFRTSGDYYDDKFVTFVELDGDNIKVRYQCLDPAGIMKPLLARAYSSLLFSATLTPSDYFADILGGGDRCVKVSYPSPFPSENLCLVAVDGVSTRYEDRERSCRDIVRYIAATVSAKHGNYIVYFPSYRYMEKVSELFVKKYPNVSVSIQKPGMTAFEKEEFIASFKSDAKKLHVGFCVLGGSFSEGVDLPGKALIGTVIVGVGLPGLSNERNIMREYFDMTREGEGYSYAYIYPGMNNVLQAAGRVIRRDDDKGIVVLIDDRYTSERYRALYPPNWSGIYAVGDPLSLAKVAKMFWEEHEKGDH